MTALSYIQSWPERPFDPNHWTAESNPSGRIIGIQTRLTGPDRGPMIHGGTSSPFHATDHPRKTRDHSPK